MGVIIVSLDAWIDINDIGNLDFVKFSKCNFVPAS